jgi:hypothetical protein
MAIFAAYALLTIIDGIANMATTKATEFPKKQSSPSKKKASSPIKRELTTMTISTNKKMGKSSYICKIMQFKNDLPGFGASSNTNPTKTPSSTCSISKSRTRSSFARQDSSQSSTAVTMVEKIPQLITLKMDIHANLSLLVKMERPMNPKLNASQK